jgi:hypothetical protein
MENITPREKAALLLYVLEPFNNQIEIYKIAEEPERLTKLKTSTIKKQSSIWINTPRIQEAIKEIRLNQVRKEEQIKQDYINSLETVQDTETIERIKKSQDTDKTNFLDRDEFLQFLNDRANEIQDDKTRNDILKMLSDNLRYKDTERDENNEIQRFYTPVVCSDCSIYRKCKDCTLSDCPRM